MCGRFASQLPPDAMRAIFQTLNTVPNIAPTWNLAPTQDAMVVRWHPDTGERRLDLLRWGLIPLFTKDLKAARKPINARSETAATSGMFRGALAQRRFLVPALGVLRMEGYAGRKAALCDRQDRGEPLVFAGLWKSWRAPDGEVVRTFAIPDLRSEQHDAAAACGGWRAARAVAFIRMRKLRLVSTRSFGVS